MDGIRGIRTISELSAEYNLHPVQINIWKRSFQERAVSIFERENERNEELASLTLE